MRLHFHLFIIYIRTNGDVIKESKNVYIDKLDKVVDKYNNTYHITIKMKAVNVKSSTYIDFGRKNNEKDPNFRVGDHVRISKYKTIFAKAYTPN